jgi:large subunit ribosomal protein L28
MPPLRPSPPSLTSLRTFTTSSPCPANSNTIKRLSSPKHSSAIPPYPYGESKWYKQSNFGLYGLQKIRFGNMVSERNEIKTRRVWRPNVQNKRLWSNALERFVRVKITTRVLRTVDKCGGLDEYLLGEKPARIKELGLGGWRLRWRIMQTEAVRERFRRQREELGLLPKEVGRVGSDGMPVSKEAVAEEIQRYDEKLAKEADVGIGEDVEEVVGAEEQFMEEKPTEKRKIVL